MLRLQSNRTESASIFEKYDSHNRIMQTSLQWTHDTTHPLQVSIFTAVQYIHRVVTTVTTCKTLLIPPKKPLC